ncbi:MAG: hypothetical protein A2845_00970 [Candidatus Lloydbacteria bacterium RIFCSPHIGHO2_01_FULL_49_22]|uniref:Uncharacterized protein n=1 Tax=Candidatus Lloydbacteria bacterium RIFCSPHIGHO2_01_FULL_49_22 TaxID=1798658 RepID=A0A1G2CYB4_9BACT|nr:MAG: hypothetical protein A2845_00970 [Candidatus Lloydbacteria bacterium RIFCSPHIGHO2_01_FULL_49_22]OGZ09921.1 MAG: hypothetical protein A3C14_04340 [Candidatus Lloydbacteria bacterium RIFCSPHIGHO2_02_FULL_50_18]
MAELLSLKPYAATMEVSLELPLITMQVVLCFGPFNSLEKAEEWTGEVERLHRGIETEEVSKSGEVFDATGLPTGAFVRSYVHGTDIIQVGQSARKQGNLIPVNTPEVDARDLHIYALRAIEEATNMAFMALGL